MKKILSIVFVLFLCSTLALSISSATHNDEKETKIHSYIEYEDLDLQDSSSYYVSVWLRFREDGVCPEMEPVSAEATGEEVDALLASHRKRVKEYYSKMNQRIIEESGLDKFDCSISWYAPFAEILFDDISEYEQHEDELKEIVLNNTAILDMSLMCFEDGDDIASTEAYVNPDTNTPAYPLSTAFSDIGVGNPPYTGNGIKIGVLEPNEPSPDYKPAGYMDGCNASHITVVSSIIGGTSGVAKNAQLYRVTYEKALFLPFQRGLNLLIDEYKVHIINMSACYNLMKQYDYICAYIDRVVQTTKCTFVNSAGNEGTKDAVISTPGYGMNVIAVGSIDSDKNVSSFSSWKSSDPYSLKPDVVAPGGRISEIPNITDEHYGTSFSAPMVTGTIALLMEEFPILKTNPALVKSVLHLGCEPLPSQTSYFDAQAGFGLINYGNMRNCLSNIQYANFSIPVGATKGSTVLSKNVSLQGYAKIDININWLFNSPVNKVLQDEPYTPLYSNCELKLFDITAGEYVQTNSPLGNCGFITYKNPSNATRNYRIDVVLSSDKVGDMDEYGAIAFEAHVHNYNRWKPLNSTKHIEQCACGSVGIKTAFHVTSSSSRGRYASCLACGYAVDLWDTPVIGIAAIGKLSRSINGSYILPSGIIVLVDADVEAYFNGTLVFYPPDAQTE